MSIPFNKSIAEAAAEKAASEAATMAEPNSENGAAGGIDVRSLMAAALANGGGATNGQRRGSTISEKEMWNVRKDTIKRLLEDRRILVKRLAKEIGTGNKVYVQLSQQAIDRLDVSLVNVIKEI
jgi:hypothetical protein